MGLITEEVEIKLNGSNMNHFEDLGYEIPRRKNVNGILTVCQGTTIKVKVRDLSNNSHLKIDVKCDNCGEELKGVIWQNYINHIHKDDKYYCRECARILFGINKMKQTKLNNSKSFQDWCIEYKRQDVLDRWDYELNDCKPEEITYGTNKKHYFKCPRGHKSELKNIGSFTSGKAGAMDCKICNSFAYYLVSSYGEDALDKYWDWEKNDKLGINPWEIPNGAHKPKVYIICQEKDYHESYDVIPKSFVRGTRCPYCCTFHGKVHPLDSLGKLLEDKGLLHLWGDKNKRSAFEYTPMSCENVWWKCQKGVHKDYFRSIHSSNSKNFCCPECKYSKGEKKVIKWLNNHNFIKITQKEYNKLNNLDKLNNKYYITQKKFKGLVGLKNGLLSYDFYLPYYNLLIEYQGEQHEKYIPRFHKYKKVFEKQVEHDKRKKLYAQNNNINLLEIWYYDFNNVESILNDYFNNINIINY